MEAGGWPAADQSITMLLVANDCKGSDQAADLRSAERPVPAHPCRCRTSRRRSVDRTRSGHSTVTAATALYAPHLPFAIPVGIGSVG